MAEVYAQHLYVRPRWKSGGNPPVVLAQRTVCASLGGTRRFCHIIRKFV